MAVARPARRSRSGASTLIKVCGVTNADDAKLAAQSGADFIGMIMWPKAKRSVSIQTARQIVAVARESDATPVGVFVDEDAATIAARRVFEIYYMNVIISYIAVGVGVRIRPSAHCGRVQCPGMNGAASQCSSLARCP